MQALAAEATTLKLQIALQQNDAEGFEQHVLDISTPSHPKYGLHFESHVSLHFGILRRKLLILSRMR
jgi:tripeptidyl-peptidase-1